jgi:hypothetical protein
MAQPGRKIRVHPARLGPALRVCRRHWLPAGAGTPDSSGP